VSSSTFSSVFPDGVDINNTARQLNESKPVPILASLIIFFRRSPPHLDPTMDDDETRLRRVVERLQNVPLISLPTDYPRPTVGNKLVEAAYIEELPEQASRGLLKLALFDDESDDVNDDNSDSAPAAPSVFHFLLSAFTVLLHRYTGDQDIIIGSSSAVARDPLLLRLSVDPSDPFWAIVRKVQQVERDAEADVLPYETIAKVLAKDRDEKPLFRVRFFDETDSAKDSFIRSTSLTSDLTVFVARATTTSRTSLAPHITLKILYNSLLFTQTRIAGIVDQLSTFLRRVASKPLSPIGSVPLLTDSQKERLPEPTADLNWCDWKGSITDIFSQNALKFPDRTCVVQTPGDKNPHSITHTYGAIRRAANVLAHHLLAYGVQREEVVMIYAHRSVELVIAVLATLKTGATFSVIGSSSMVDWGSGLNTDIWYYRPRLSTFPPNRLSRSRAPSGTHRPQRSRKNQPQRSEVHKFRIEHQGRSSRLTTSRRW